MNIKKKIIFTGLSLLLSNAFNSVYSGESAEKNLDDAMNLSRKQPSHINYLDLDLNQLQGLLPIDDDTIKDDSAFMLFDDDPLQQENSSVSTGNEEDDNFDFCFSAEDFNQELFELLANSILTQDISTNSSDAADTAQASGQPLEKSGRKARTKTMRRSVQEIETRNEAIREFIAQHKEQNPSTNLTYAEIQSGLEDKYPGLTLKQLERFFKNNKSLRTSINSQESPRVFQFDCCLKYY